MSPKFDPSLLIQRTTCNLQYSVYRIPLAGPQAYPMQGMISQRRNLNPWTIAYAFLSFYSFLFISFAFFLIYVPSALSLKRSSISARARGGRTNPTWKASDNPCPKGPKWEFESPTLDYCREIFGGREGIGWLIPLDSALSCFCPADPRYPLPRPTHFTGSNDPSWGFPGYFRRHA
jgi:hypothetical protein